METAVPKAGPQAQSLVSTQRRDSLAKTGSHGSEVKGQELIWPRGLEQVTVHFQGHEEGHQELEGSWPPHQEPQSLAELPCSPPPSTWYRTAPAEELN